MSLVGVFAAPTKIVYTLLCSASRRCASFAMAAAASTGLRVAKVVLHVHRIELN